MRSFGVLSGLLEAVGGAPVQVVLPGMRLLPVLFGLLLSAHVKMVFENGALI